MPKLIHRVAHNQHIYNIIVERPLKVTRSKLLRHNELERHVEFLRRKLQGQGAILILLDSDDDCPASLGPELLKRALRSGITTPVGLVLADKEYESWFLATADSLAGCQGFPSDISPVRPAERIRGAKEWLSKHLGRNYNPTLDQAIFTSRFDIGSAIQHSRSFEKCFREIVNLMVSSSSHPAENSQRF